MKILICGAGSIGIYLGTLLNSKQHEVHLFGRRKLKETPNRVFIEGKSFFLPKKLFYLIKDEDYDFVFITTKLYDFSSMVKILKKNKISSKIFAAIQNGLVNFNEYEKLLKKRIIPICVFSGFKLEKNKIFISSTPVGWKTENSLEGKKISKLISSLGIKCSVEKNLDSIRAEKTIVNSTLNTLSAIKKKSFKNLFRDKKIRIRIDNLFSECYEILKKKYLLKNKEKMKRDLYKNWANLNHFSSTYQDLISGRKLETNFFNGYLIQIGKKQNLPVCENKKIIKELKNINKKDGV